MILCVQYPVWIFPCALMGLHFLCAFPCVHCPVCINGCVSPCVHYLVCVRGGLMQLAAIVSRITNARQCTRYNTMHRCKVMHKIQCNANLQCNAQETMQCTRYNVRHRMHKMHLANIGFHTAHCTAHPLH